MDRKKLICETCGGQLRIDHERNTYVCQFCGITYDYSFFNEDDIISKAEIFLKRGEFNAARDAFMFLLSKEPHNAYALEKLILIRYHLRDVSDLSYNRRGRLKKADTQGDEKIIEQAGDDATRKRLETIHKCIESQLRLAEIEPRIKDLNSRIDIDQRKFDNAEVDYIGVKKTVCGDIDGPMTVRHIRKYFLKKYLLVLLIAFAIFSVGPILYGMAKSNMLIASGGLLNIGIVALLAAIPFAMNCRQTVRDVESRESQIAIYGSKLEELKAQRDELVKERNTITGTIKRCVASL